MLVLSLASLLFVIAFNCFSVHSQVAKIGAVHSKPTKLSDYLILEKDYPDASYWDIKILIREFDDVDSVFTFSEVQNTRMSKSFYQKIDSRYLNKEEYFITVVGYNGYDDIIVEEGPFPICIECQVGFSCQWGCIGKTYAYSLNLNPVNSGSSMVSLGELTPSNGYYSYYYEWVDEEDWSSFSSNSANLTYYGLSNNFSLINPGNAGKIIKKTNVDTDQNLKDADNNLCLGTVFGVRKYLGPWEASQGNMYSNPIISSETNCGQSFNWALNTINSNEDNFSNSIPSLSCNGENITPTDVDQPNVFGDIEEVSVDFVNCFHDVVSDENNTIYYFIEYGNCGPSQGNALEWPEFINTFTIFSMTDSTFSPVIVSKDSIINKDGDINFNGFNLYSGLYYVGLEFTDGNYLSSYFERTDTIFQSLTQSNFLNYNPYPNPLTSNAYQIDFEATANVEFVYEVKNSSGVTVFSRSYKLDKDETLNDRIALTIPSNYSGFLYNTITFTDSSTLQFTLVK